MTNVHRLFTVCPYSVEINDDSTTLWVAVSCCDFKAKEKTTTWVKVARKGTCLSTIGGVGCARPQAPHTCPYSVEINDDSTTLCTCCEACQRECVDDI